MSVRSIEMDVPAAATGGLPAVSQARVSDFLRLLKPRVMSLVVFSGFAGLYVAPGEIHPLLAAVAVLCIAVAAGAAAPRSLPSSLGEGTPAIAMGTGPTRSSGPKVARPVLRQASISRSAQDSCPVLTRTV